MDSDIEKIIVRGISQDTDENLLGKHFTKFGMVLEVEVIRDKATGLNQGFAYVLFSNPDVVARVIQHKHHIDDKEVIVEKMKPREEQNPARRSGVNVRDNRIYVGSLSSSVTSKDLRDYFQIYGAVSDAVIITDQLTKRPKGYGFVSFDSEVSMEHALHRTYQDLNGTRVEVKRAHPPKDFNLGVTSGGRGTGVFLGGGGAGASSGSGGAGATSGGRGVGAASASGGGARAFPVYGGSSGSGYEGHMDSNRYMRPQNTGSGYPPYGASGYDYRGFGGYGYPAGVPYGDPGVPGASGPSSSWGAQVSSSYGNVDYGNAARGGGFGGYGYQAGAPYGNPGVPGASGPSSSWSTQVSSGYGNVIYRNAALGGGSGPSSSVMGPAVGSAGYGYGGNDSSYGPPSAYGAVDWSGSGSGSADASNGAGGYGNHQRTNRQAGYGGSCGKGKQVQQ